MSKSPSILTIGVGWTNIVALDLEEHPHVFIAGASGSGKSNILKCLLHQALRKGYEVVLIDFKMGVSFSHYIDEIEVVYEYKQAIETLNTVHKEATRRLLLFCDNRVEKLEEYNRLFAEKMRRIVVLIDEVSELMTPIDRNQAKIIKGHIESLSRIARASGIHLIMGMQRPDSTIISGQIKTNVTFRVCGKVPDKIHSQIVLDNDKAFHLPDVKGRFIVNNQEVQAFYFEQPKGLVSAPKDTPPTPSQEMPKAVETSTAGIEFDFSKF